MEGDTATPGAVALLFTDIEASTSLWVNHPDTAGAAFGLHDEIVSRTIGAHKGSVIKTTGDGFLASFPTVRLGVEAAIDAQLALSEQADDLLNASRVRMALHAGTVEERGGDLFGLAVHKCERIMAAAAAGQILLSNAAAAALRDDPAPETDVLDLGDQRLKGIPGVERVYQLLHPGLRRDFPTLGTAAGPATNIQLELTSFIGRDREVAEVVTLLGEHRLVTLTGEGGAGKTRLAVQVGSAGLSSYPGGVWFVELDSLRDPGLVGERLASTLGLEERAGRSYEDLVAAHLRGKQALLILDNCEHLLDVCAQIADLLLKSVPDLHVVATSRQRLGVSSEVDYRVPPMSVPPADGEPDDVGDHDSVRLFVDRARLARPSFALTPANAASVARIVRRLDGLPLGIELAAAKVTALSPAQIADHLDDRFRLLTDGARTVMPRHRTLEAAIGWSYELLTAEERRFFAQLAIFRGGFDLTAAEHVCAGAAETGDVVTILAALVDKSLVVVEADIGRYRLLETIRQYAAARLDEAGSTEAAAARHGEYYTTFAERAGSGLEGPEQAFWLRALDAELDNLRASLEWSIDHEPMPLRLMASLWRFWLLRSRPSEGLEWLRRALAVETGGTDAWRVQALLGTASLSSRSGDQQSARQALVEATALAEKTGDQNAAAVAIAAIAVIQHKEGDLRAATASLRTALSKARDAPDHVQTSRVLTNLALVLEDQGEHGEAASCAAEAMEVAQKTGIPDLIADAMLTAGEIALNQADDDSARTLLEGALGHGMDTGLDDITAWAQSYLGKLALQSGDLQACRAVLGEAIELFRSMESPMGTEWALRHLALAEVKSGELDSARLSAGEALRLAAEYVRPDTPYVLYVAGEIAAAFGEYVGAAEIFAAARHLGGVLQLRLPVFESREFASAWESVKSALADEDLEAARTRGEAHTLDEAAQLAKAVMAEAQKADHMD